MMGSTPIFAESDTFADGTRYEMVATVVPESEDYPAGIKYRFQYMAEDGRTLLRFDNFPHHPDVGRHHCHDADGVHDVEFVDVRTHVKAFFDAVDAHRDG